MSNPDPTPPAVSDTPRTDAAKWSAPVNWSHSRDFVDADTCLEIERDLNAAVAALKEASQLLETSAQPFDEACTKIRTVLAQIGGRA